MTEQQPALPTNEVEALRETKAVLQRQGRLQGTSFKDGKVCLAAAVGVAVGVFGPTGDYLDRGRDRERFNIRTLNVLNATVARTSQVWTSAILFNDAYGTTDEDVYALIDAAIASLEAGDDTVKEN
jgi:hypothetical protein